MKRAVANNFRPISVAPLLIETNEERRLFEEGEENYRAKKALRKRSLLERAPKDEESGLIHTMWMKEMSYLSKARVAVIPGQPSL